MMLGADQVNLESSPKFSQSMNPDLSSVTLRAIIIREMKLKVVEIFGAGCLRA